MKIVFLTAALALFVAVNLWAFRSQLRKVQTIPLPAQNVVSPAKNGALDDVQIVVLSLTQCTLDGEIMEIAKVKDQLAIAKRAGKKSVSVKSAPGVPYNALVPVLDVIRQAEVERVSIQVGQPARPLTNQVRLRLS